MALVLNDRVKETTTTTGTGTVNLGGAETGFETFVAGVGDGNTTYYCITAGAEFEVGLGTVTDASPDTLSRTTILSSSNSDSAVDFSAGTKDVFCTLPASKAVFEDASSNVTLPGTLDVDGGITVDNITIDGTEIDLSSGNLTLDAAGDIILDADGGDITFKDAGTEIGHLSNSSSDFIISSAVNDKDLKFQGTDNNSVITALTLDMSEAGAATFNDNVTAFSDERLKDNIETLEDSLDKVEQLRGVTYTRDGKENIGVIAQEIEKILPEIVLTADDEMGTKSVDYSRITAVLIEAVKDLSARVKELESK